MSLNEHFCDIQGISSLQKNPDPIHAVRVAYATSACLSFRFHLYSYVHFVQRFVPSIETLKRVREFLTVWVDQAVLGSTENFFKSNATFEGVCFMFLWVKKYFFPYFFDIVCSIRTKNLIIKGQEISETRIFFSVK